MFVEPAKHEAFNPDFLALSPENRRKVVEMTKFLVLAQETIVPAMLARPEREGRPERRRMW